jgi:hypothetical protein
MLVRFTKGSVTSKTDTLVCERADGTTTHSAMPKQGILPHDALHFVVETTLGWHDAFFGQIAAGASLDQITAKLHGQKIDRAKNIPALQSESLVECLQAEQWGGGADPAAFTIKLAAACRAHHVAPPALTAADLIRVRLALREFGAAWRPLSPGKSLERTF